MSYDRVGQVTAKLAVLVMLAGALAIGACGKEGPPTPPLRAVPAPVKDLAARQRGNRVLLSFTYPQTTPGGQALNGVTRVELYEAIIPPPPPPKATPAKPGAAAAPAGKAATAGAAAPGTGGTGTAGAAAGSAGAGAAPPAPLSPPAALDPRQFENLAKPRLVLTGKDLGAATLGRLIVADLPLPEPLPATAESGPTHDYAVRTYGPKADRSAISNQVLLKAQVPPPPPEGVTATGQADGILVEWKPVPGAGGYAVYRRAATERFSSKPLAVVKPPESRYLDQSARFGQSYIYSVTAVDPKQPLIESAIKSEQEIHYVDRYPPPVPEELVAVAEAGRVRLVWRQSEAADLAGYIVYRKGAATGEFVRLTAKPIAATSYVDTTVASGQTYDYRVTAIDQTGNESAPSTEVHVAVP
jgi:fibronectin type 3 domain-containing protein